MPRPITILIGLLISATIGATILSLFGFESNRQINDNIAHLGEDYFTNRVKLFAIPAIRAEAAQFDKVDRLKWHQIRTEMLKYRKDIEKLEMRSTPLDLVCIILYALSFVAIMIYSPALWVSEFRFGNEKEKFLFNVGVFLMLITAFIIRIYAYYGISKFHYTLITAKAKPVLEQIGGIKLSKAIHFCYYGVIVMGSLREDHTDGHELTHVTHLHMDRVASAATACHAELLDIIIISISALSCFIHILLFCKTNRLGKDRLELFMDIETVENALDAPGDSSSEEEYIDMDENYRDDNEPVKRKQMLPDRNPKDIFYVDDDDEKYNETAETMIETLMDAAQLEELHEVYLKNYHAATRHEK